MRRKKCCCVVTLVASCDGCKSHKLLEGNLSLSLNLSQSKGCDGSGSTSHGSKCEMGPSGSVCDRERCTRLQNKGRSKV